jgi:2-octaprenyl-3-methyl-6-methoxy-1,4-benzoquinol hydroxylase
MKKFDCVVIGGGMVGAASALAVAQLGLTVALVEP